MRADDIPPDNTIQVHIRNFHAANDPTTPITDATLAYTITIASSGGAVVGGTAIAMPHDANGNYFGNSTPTLTAGTRYKVVITCSNYVARWTRYFNAKVRPFK